MPFDLYPCFVLCHFLILFSEIHRSSLSKYLVFLSKSFCLNTVLLDMTFTGPRYWPIFMYFVLHPICNPLTKKNEGGMFKRFISLRLLATDINLQGLFKSQNWFAGLRNSGL